MAVTFQHPYAAPTETLNLRNPNLGNSEQTEIRTQFRRAMDGDIHSYRRTAATKKLLLIFAEISKPNLQEVFDFIALSAGDEIKYTDHDAVVWRGYIVNEPVQSQTTSKKGGSCIEVNTFTIEFIGSVV